MANDTHNLPPETTLAGQPDPLQPPDPLVSKTLPNDPHVVVLTTPQGESYSLTDKKLESWFAALERSNIDSNLNQEFEEDDEGLATQFLSRFGMKSPTDVIAFLKSAEGKAATAMIREEMAKIESMEEYDQFLADEEIKKEQRMLGSLFLALMYESDAEADSLNELIATQNEQRIQHAHDAATGSPVDEAAFEHDILVEQQDAFKSAVGAVDDKLKVKTAELEAVDKTITQLEQQKQALDADHKVFDDHLAELDGFLASTDPQANQAELIDQRISALQTTMDKQDEEIKGLIEAGKNAEVNPALTKRQGLQLQMDGLREKQDVLKGKKHFCDAEGNPVKSPKDAKLVLDIGKKIVKDPADGRCHLIGAHEELQSIKSSGNAQERLSASQKNYQQTLTGNTSVRAKVDTSKQLKEELHLQRHSAALKQKASLQGDISLLTTQKTKLQTDKLEVERKLVQSNQAKLSAPSGSLAPNAAPTLKPQPKSQLQPQSQSTRKPSQKPEDELTAAINQLKKDRSPAAFKRVGDLAKPYNKHPQFNSLIDTIEKIKNMPRLAPIPQITMNSLLQNVERFGVSAEKPNVAPLDAETLAKTPEETPEANTPDNTHP